LNSTLDGMDFGVCGCNVAVEAADGVYRANGLWEGYNWSLHIYCVSAGERVSCRWAEGMGANNCAMDLAGDKFDKAYYVESYKGARIVEKTCLQGSKPISNRRRDRYRKSCLGSSKAVPTSAFIVFLKKIMVG